MSTQEPTFISRRVDNAIVFISGTRVSGDQLATFLDGFRASHPIVGAWTATELSAAFARRFDVAVDVRRFTFDGPGEALAFHIRSAADRGWAERPAV